MLLAVAEICECLTLIYLVSGSVGPNVRRFISSGFCGLSVVYFGLSVFLRFQGIAYQDLSVIQVVEGMGLLLWLFTYIVVLLGITGGLQDK